MEYLPCDCKLDQIIFLHWRLSPRPAASAREERQPQWDRCAERNIDTVDRHNPAPLGCGQPQWYMILSITTVLVVVIIEIRSFWRGFPYHTLPFCEGIHH